MNYSLIKLPLFHFSVCLALTACGSSSPTSVSLQSSHHYASGVQTIESFDQRYGLINSTVVDKYFGELLVRLDPVNKGGGYKVKIVRTEQPIAWSPGGGFICLSTGLIKNLQSESEIAFVLAHEVAHYELNHLGKKNEASVDSFERDADALGLKKISAAGYTPASALSSILRMHTLDTAAVKLATNVHHYPSIQERLRSLSVLIKQIPSQLGIQDRREFQKMRQMMQ